MKKTLFTLLILVLTTSIIQAQKKEQKAEDKTSLHLKIKSEANPVIYVDGKKFDFPIYIINPDNIASMNVIKGEEAINKYNAPEGVLLITTKKPNDDGTTSFEINDFNEVDFDKVKTNVRIRQSKTSEPMIIIDGKEASQDELRQLKAEQIEAIEVLKDEAAKALYDADNGVIIVKTKDRNKEKEEK